MMLLNDQQLERFEKTLQEVATEVSSDTAFENTSPSDIWSKVEAPVNTIKELAENLKETMLIMKPEKHLEIEHLYAKVIEPFNVFKATLFNETTDSSTNSQRALEQLRKATVSGSTFLDLAKEIRHSPSQTMLEILKLKEVYEAKEYLAAVEAPKTFQVRLKSLLKHIEALNTSITSLEMTLDGIKNQLTNVQEASLTFLSQHVDITAKDYKDAPISESEN